MANPLYAEDLKIVRQMLIASLLMIFKWLWPDYRLYRHVQVDLHSMCECKFAEKKQENFNKHTNTEINKASEDVKRLIFDRIHQATNESLPWTESSSFVLLSCRGERVKKNNTKWRHCKVHVHTHTRFSSKQQKKSLISCNRLTYVRDSRIYTIPPLNTFKWSLIKWKAIKVHISSAVSICKMARYGCAYAKSAFVRQRQRRQQVTEAEKRKPNSVLDRWCTNRFYCLFF